MLNVQELNIHPLKSGHRVSVPRLEVMRGRIAHDRGWMLVDESGVMLSQRDREFRRLAQVRVDNFETDEVMFTAPFADHSLRVSKQVCEEIFDLREVEIHGRKTLALDAGDEAAAWFSGAFGQPCRLVRRTEQTLRKMDPEFSGPDDYAENFSDGFPVLIANLGSLRALAAADERARGVPINRFRANIVVDAEPFIEDTWKRIRIGRLELDIAKPCARCPIPNVDQDAGEIAERKIGPVLSAWRGATRMEDGRKVNEMFFAQNAIPRLDPMDHPPYGIGYATISVGDEVKVLETGPVHDRIGELKLGAGPG